MIRKTIYLCLLFTLIIIMACSDKTTDADRTVATPVFNIPGGTYTTPKTVVITCATEGAVIRYTSDGSEPTPFSTIYTTALLISESKVIKARGFKPGWIFSEVAQLNIVIDEFEVSSIEFDELPETIFLNSIVPVKARALDIDGNPAPDGLIINFSTSKGHFINDLDYATTLDGWATINWNTGTESGVTVLSAIIDEVSEDYEVHILPGNPATIELSMIYHDNEGDIMPIPEEGIPLDFPYVTKVKAVVKDIYNNSVPGVIMSFHATHGEVQNLAMTDGNGIAYANYYLATSPGTVQISVSIVDSPEPVTSSIDFLIYSDEVLYMIFNNQDEIYLDAVGVGENNAVVLEVGLVGWEGLVFEQHLVNFEIIPIGIIPDGANINNSGTSDQVFSEDGIAVATLYSGTGVGYLRVRASLVEDPAINALSPIIRISGGPHSVHLVISDNDTAFNMGGGIWRIEVGAVVKEIDNTSVVDGTPVWFSLGDDPEIPADCYIEPESYTGNPTPSNEDGTPGYAGTFLYYHGIDTFRQITIIAQAGNVTGSLLATLPINLPNLEVTADPPIISFYDDDPPNAYQDVELIIDLTDGQNSQITNGNIKIIAPHGEFIYFEWFDDQNDPINNPSVPDIVTSYIGVAKGAIRFRKWEIPPPGNQEEYSTLEVPVSVFLIGTDSLAQTTVTIRRYSTPNPGI